MIRKLLSVLVVMALCVNVYAQEAPKQEGSGKPAMGSMGGRGSFTPTPFVRPETMPEATPENIDKAIAKGVEYLKTKGQGADGSFSKFMGIGITAFVTGAMLDAGLSPDDPAVAKGLKYLERFVQPDGGIYNPDMMLITYESCIAIDTFVKANADGRYDKILKRAETFIRSTQYNEENGYSADNLNYGGSGYGTMGRADLSNTGFFLDALKSLGAKADDPAIQKAMVFVSRCQNCESPHNTTKFADKNPDGGFFYVYVGDGNMENGGMRSYGSMSYTGLKSFIYANMDTNDVRYKAAMDWIKKYYTVQENPMQQQAGVYYYFNTFGKTMSLLGQDSFTDANGKAHNWRAELASEIIARQQPDGSWKNGDSNRWMENDQNLATAYAIKALAMTKK